MPGTAGLSLICANDFLILYPGFAREQEADILAAVLRHVGPTVLHADGGVGKSMMALRLAATLPPGSQAVVYDCFGDGMYRSAHNWRHRHQDAFTQIANELAGRGLCHPLIPTTADPKAWVRAFRHRLAQAATTVRSAVPDAVVCIIIDAADNAEMAAVDNGEAASFVRDLIAMPLPDGIRLVFTCRSHRRDLLNAPAGLQDIELQPFSLVETIAHLRRRYQAATEAEAAEFRHVSSANPRVQALAMDRGLPIAEMLQALGPNPTTIEAAIGELLASAIAELKIRTGRADAHQIDSICEGLAVLRPLIPIPVLEQLTGIDGGAIRSFAYDLGRPLLVRGDTLHFMDEPAETWFRETFTPQAAAFDVFIERLRPLAKTSAYVAGTLPQLLLEAGRHDELVELALSDDALPTDNPLERRDVELRRLLFALKASLKRKKFLPAAKLALKVAGEAAGESRQISILKSNTHLGARLLAPDRILDLASRRLFGAQWMGSHHAYEAVLLSGTADFTADAASRLRMAMDWLMAWARRIDDEDPNSGSRIEVTDEDRAALALASLRLKGPKSAARFLRRWRYRPISFTAGGRLADQLVDLGEFDALSDLAAAARNDAWLLLALAQAARGANRTLPAEPLARLLKLLESRRVQLKESNHWNEQWYVLQAVTAAVELALVVLPPEPERWAALLRRYLPAEPPHELSSRLPYDRSTLLRPYALEAALRGAKVEPAEVAPKDVRREITRSGYSSYSADAETFLREVGGLLPWVRLSSEIRCGRPPANLIAAIADCLSESEKAGRRGYREDYDLRNAVARQWLSLLAETGTVQPEAIASFKAWRNGPGRTMWPATLTSLVRVAARTNGLQEIAIDLAVEAHGLISSHREDAQTRTASYLDLARAVFTASSADATAYFDEAVAIASRIGDENLDRWAAFLHLVRRAAEARTPRPETAYRFSRMAELTYEYVERDKHFPWHDTTEALSDLCPTSALAILGRWRDRRFGRRGRLLPIVIERLVSQGRLSSQSLVALSGLEMEWDRATDLMIYLEAETEEDRRRRGAEIAYRYLRLGTTSGEAWNRLRDLVAKEDWPLGDMERIHLINSANAAIEEAARTKAAAELAAATSGEVRPAPWERPPPDWKEIFEGADVTTPEGLTLAFERMRSGEPPFETETFWREAAARTPTGREAELMRAIADGPDFSIFAFHYALKQMPAAWQGRPAYRRSLRETVLKLCERDPVHVYRRGFNRLLPFDDLIAASVLTDADIVDACLTGFAASLEVLNAGELFRLLDPLASRLTPVEADEPDGTQSEARGRRWPLERRSRAAR